MSPRPRSDVERLLSPPSPPKDLDFVDLTIAELCDIPLSAQHFEVGIKVHTEALLEADHDEYRAYTGIALIREPGDRLHAEVTHYRAIEDWDLPIPPDVYGALFLHVVGTREAGEQHLGPVMRLLRPHTSCNDLETDFSYEIVLDPAQVADLATAYTVALATDAQVRADVLRLLFSPESSAILTDRSPDHVIPPDRYLELAPGTLAENAATFQRLIATAPERLDGRFLHGAVTVTLDRGASGHYAVAGMSILVSRGKFSTVTPVPVSGLDAWLRGVGAPLEAFTWTLPSKRS